MNKMKDSCPNTYTIDPFCKQAWMEYCRRFCVYSITGLAVGATCAFVFMGTFVSDRKSNV